MDTRICNTCRRALPIEQFKLVGRGRSRKCRTCTDVNNQAIPLPIDGRILQQKLEVIEKAENTRNIDVAAKLNSLEQRIIQQNQQFEEMRRINETTLNDIHILNTYVENAIKLVDDKVDELAKDNQTVQTLFDQIQGTIDTSNKDIIDRITMLFNEQSRRIDNIKIDLSQFITTVTPTLSGATTPLFAGTPPIAHSPPRKQAVAIVPKSPTKDQKISFSDTVFSNTFIQSLSNSDLARYINTASNASTYHKKRSDPRYDIAKTNTDLLRAEAKRRK
jgi:hypothetical protein